MYNWYIQSPNSRHPIVWWYTAGDITAGDTRPVIYGRWYTAGDIRPVIHGWWYTAGDIRPWWYTVPLPILDPIHSNTIPSSNSKHPPIIANHTNAHTEHRSSASRLQQKITNSKPISSINRSIERWLSQLTAHRSIDQRDRRKERKKVRLITQSDQTHVRANNKRGAQDEEQKEVQVSSPSVRSLWSIRLHSVASVEHRKKERKFYYSSIAHRSIDLCSLFFQSGSGVPGNNFKLWISFFFLPKKYRHLLQILQTHLCKFVCFFWNGRNLFLDMHFFLKFSQWMDNRFWQGGYIHLFELNFK